MSCSPCGARLPGVTREVGQAAPQHQPQRPGHRRADRRGPPRTGGWPRPVRARAGPPAARTGSPRRRAVDRARGAVQHPARGPHRTTRRQRPGDRGGQRGPDRRAARRCPGPSSSWIVAKAVLRQHEMMPDQAGVPGDRARRPRPGCPAAVAASIWLKPLVNMNDWYCSTPSSSQIAASPSCRPSTRRGLPVLIGCPVRPAPPGGLAHPRRRSGWMPRFSSVSRPQDPPRRASSPPLWLESWPGQSPLASMPVR